MASKECAIHTDIETLLSPSLLKVFSGLIGHPGRSGIWMIAVLVASVLISCKYSELQSKPVALMKPNLPLSDVAWSLMNDFPLGFANMQVERVVIWSDHGDLRNMSAYKSVINEIDAALLRISRTSKKCIDLQWQGYSRFMLKHVASHFMSEDNSAAMVMIAMSQTGEMPQLNPCVATLREKFAEIDRMYSKIHVCMGSEGAVAHSSFQRVNARTTHHILVSSPVMFAMLVLATGSITRSLTPFLVLAYSICVTRGITVVIKVIFKDFNIGTPMTVVMFIELALSLDYGLFFWRRFSQERKQNPDSLAYHEAIMTTLKTTGVVIMCSVTVLWIAYLTMCLYPVVNAFGILQVNLQSMVGITSVGVCSLAIPAILAAKWPNLFDEPKGDEAQRAGPLSSFAAAFSKAFDRVFEILGSVITTKPWTYVLPLLIFTASIPLLVELTKARPNYDIRDSTTSKFTAEYAASQVYAQRFHHQQANSIPVLLEAEQLGLAPLHDELDSMSFLQVHIEVQPSKDRHINVQPPTNRSEMSLSETSRPRMITKINSTGIIWTAHFEDKVCDFMRAVVKETKGTKYEIGAQDIESIYWNSTTGTCLGYGEPRLLVDTTRFAALDQSKMMLILNPKIGSSSPEAQALSSYLLNKLEPHSKGVFEHNGNLYRFSARHFSPLTQDVLLHDRWKKRATWVVAGMVIAICAIVSILFSSLGIGLKLVLTVMLPIAAEYGLLVGAYQDGWLRCFNIEPTNGVIWNLFYQTLGFLFGLAVDYDMFLFARVYERRHQGYDNESAVRLAVAETGSVITIAGSIMAVSFLFLIMSNTYAVSQVGFLYFFGVIIDTYVIRTILAPAALCVSETLNYWPSKVPPATKSWWPGQ